MIKISKNNFQYRLFSFGICAFPTFIVLFYAISAREEILHVMISVVLIIALLGINIYINIFDFELFFDSNEKCLIVKRFKKQRKFKDFQNFKIVSYGPHMSFGLQYWGILIGKEKFRFKYHYVHKSFLPLIKLTNEKDRINKEIAALMK